MDKRQLLGLGTFLAGSYTTFHGHRIGKDCWLCNYRGLGWIIAIAGIIYNDYCEKKAKETNHYHSYPTYSRRDTDWENSSDTGSDDSTGTIKGTN